MVKKCSGCKYSIEATKRVKIGNGDNATFRMESDGKRCVLSNKKIDVDTNVCVSFHNRD